MTFDFQTAFGFAMMRAYNPSPLPPSFGPTWYPPGWSTNFLNPVADIDPNHSFGWLAGTDGRSYICPSRSHGSDYMGESFDNGLAGVGWQLIQFDGGTAGIANVVDPDPALAGPALDLHTGQHNGSVGGVYRTLAGTINRSFGLFIMPGILDVGANSLDALNVFVQNSYNSCLMVRFYLNAVDIQIGGQWQRLISHGGPFIWELWIEVTDLGDGTHSVQAWAGTQPNPALVGALPTNVISNNQVNITQQSGTANYRHSQIAQINLGPTQLPDHMVACSVPVSATVSPTIGHFAMLVEDVSVTVVPNVNVNAFVTKNDLAPWDKVPLQEYLPPWGKGEIDNTKNIRLFAGSVNFSSGTGSTMRFNVESLAGTFPVFQGVAFYWE